MSDRIGSPGVTGAPAFTKTWPTRVGHWPTIMSVGSKTRWSAMRLQRHGDLGLAGLQERGAGERHVVLAGLRRALDREVDRGVLHRGLVAVMVNEAAPPWVTVAVFAGDGRVGTTDEVIVTDVVLGLTRSGTPRRAPANGEDPVRLDHVVGDRRDRTTERSGRRARRGARRRIV